MTERILQLTKNRSLIEVAFEFSAHEKTVGSGIDEFLVTDHVQVFGEEDACDRVHKAATIWAFDIQDSLDHAELSMIRSRLN